MLGKGQLHVEVDDEEMDSIGRLPHEFVQALGTGLGSRDRLAGCGAQGSGLVFVLHTPNPILCIKALYMKDSCRRTQ